MKRLAILGVLAGIAVASADSSVVVLALPDLLSQFGTSIEAASWVISSYNLVVAVGALALIRPVRRLGPGRMAIAGGSLFLVASTACALAPEIWSLIAFRTVQGLGAALLLVAAFPLLRALAVTPERGSSLWAGAGVFGAAVGPAAGGIVTDLLGWRAIFVAQAPVAAVFLVAVQRHRHALSVPATPAPLAGRRPWARWAALVLVSAALVALLFLAVVELIDVRGMSPVGAGLVASAIALAAAVAAPFATRAGASAAGALLLAGGLAGMALVPGPSLAWPIAALAVAGIGYGLIVPGLARSASELSGSPTAGGANSVALRHAGLVAGLLLLTPLLTSDLAAAGNRAELRGIAVVLEAPADVSTKLRLSFDLAPLLARPAKDGVPDFAGAVAKSPYVGVAGIGRAVDSTVRASLARGFRRSFLAASLLALGAALVLALRRRPSLRGWSAPAAALLLTAALLGTELGAGAARYGTRPQLAKPCGDEPTVTGPGSDARAQRAALATLDFIACHVHENREQLVANTARRGVDAEQFLSRLLGLARIRSLLASAPQP